MVCVPAVEETKVNAAEPFDKVSGASVLPSTTTVTVPVGVAVMAPEADATVTVTASLAPEAGVLVAGESVVVVATEVGAVELAQAESKLLKSTEPRPEASS